MYSVSNYCAMDHFQTNIFGNYWNLGYHRNVDVDIEGWLKITMYASN